MSPREILFRARHAMALRRERKQFLAGGFQWDDNAWQQRLCAGVSDRPAASDLANWWQQHMTERDEPAFLLGADTLPASLELFHELFADRVAPLRQAADRFADGHFDFLGITTEQGSTIDWHTDPKSGYAWDRAYHADLDFSFCREGGGDVKYVWELNRQEDLIDSAIVARLTGESRYADRVTDVMASWVAANPYLDGINWASALEVAIRSFCWLWSYQFCRPFDGISAEAHLDWVKAFYHNGHYLHRHLSYYFSPNNHLIGEAAALYLIGCFFPEFDEAEEWREHGWAAIEEHYRHQYYEDGGSTEQATFYHNYCLGFLTLAILARQKRGEPVPPEMLDRVEQAMNFTMWMTRGDGSVPRIGDVDNARSIRFENPPLWDFRNLLSIGAVMFNRADMKAVAGRFSEDALWLLGPEGYEKFKQLDAAPPEETVRVFPSAGYCIMRAGWGRDDHHLTFDAGPIASGLFPTDVPSSCHGHSDIMAFTLHAFGEPLFVDGGFYTYDEDPLWHRYFREASAHNTVLVDGASHAKFYASNAWSCVATCDRIERTSTADSEQISSGHSGYYDIAPAVRHYRSIEWNREDEFLVHDRLDGQGSHHVEVFFHLAPGANVTTATTDAITIETAANHFATLQRLDNGPLEADIIDGGKDSSGDLRPDTGWVGTGYGHRQRAPIVRFSGQVELPASFSFSIRCSRRPFTSAVPSDATVCSDKTESSDNTDQVES